MRPRTGIAAVAFVLWPLLHPVIARRWRRAFVAEWPQIVVEADDIIEAEYVRLMARRNHPSMRERET